MKDPTSHLPQIGADEHFRLLVESVRDYAIFMLDAEGRVATWNAGAERIKGYTADEIVGRHFSTFYAREDVEAGKPAMELEAATATGRYEEEGWRYRKDGTAFWADVVITAMRDAEGRLVGFAKVTRDLTEKRRAQEAARRLELEEVARRTAERNLEVVEGARREELRQREELRVTLSSIGDAVIVTDDRGAITFLNPVAEALTGWRVQEAIGQPLEAVFRIVNEDTRQVVESPVAKVIETGVIVGLANHTVLLARDGREIPIDDSGAPIRDEQGNMFGVVLVFRDVSEARRAVEVRTRLAAIVESSDDAIFGKDLDGVIQSWNRGAERLYGYTAAEVIGRNVSMLVPPGNPGEVPSIMARLRKGESIVHRQAARIAKDGRPIDVSLTISPIRDRSGRITGAATIARDITELKRTEQSLRVLADASDVLAELVDVSTALDKIAGLAVPRVADWCAVDLAEEGGGVRRVSVVHTDPAKVQLARELRDRFPPDPSATQGAAHVMRTGESEMLTEIPAELLEASVSDPDQLRLLRGLGLASYVCVPLRVRGKVIGALTCATAESGRRFSERDLRLVQDLASRAAIAIDNAQLYADLKIADQRKDEFLAMLAHELRNPLAPIRNAMQILRLTRDPETSARAREVVERQVDHLARLVDDLLDVSRIMRGRIELKKERVELAKVVAHATETVQPILDAHGQQLEVSVGEPVVLEVDPARLSQILANLLHNAAKFSSGPGRIRLGVGVEGGQAVLRVRDDGVGIRPDLLPHVFGLFVQGDASLQRSEGGLGIGLTLVETLVQMHGGTVEAHSEGKGRGSEFVVRLPLAAKATADARASEPVEPGEGEAVVRRVLVVDDNADAADTIATLLRMWGHEVREAYDGLEALEAAKAFAPEVVLLDIGLPGISGYEVAERLREESSFRSTVIAAMTGYGQAKDRERSREAGFDHHLIKPVELDALRVILESPRDDLPPGEPGGS